MSLLETASVMMDQVALLSQGAGGFSVDGALTLAAEDGPKLAPLEHVKNHKLLVVDGWWIWSAHQTNLVLSGIILLILGPFIAKHVGTGAESEGHKRYVTSNPFAQLIEVICIFLRDEIVRPLLGERTERFMPFLWSLFFFILVNNFLGLIPLLDLQALIAYEAVYKNHYAVLGGTATQSLWVTGVLATVSFFVINIAGVKELGVKGYCAHLTGGAPPAFWALMIPIEIVGTFIKPIALAIRLFANMTAGHTLMATLFGFVGFASTAGLLVWTGVTLSAAVAATAIYFLEIFVGFLQAFVFMFLTTVFIGQLSHHGDHDHEHEEHMHANEVHDMEKMPATPTVATAG